MAKQFNDFPKVVTQLSRKADRVLTLLCGKLSFLSLCTVMFKIKTQPGSISSGVLPLFSLVTATATLGCLFVSDQNLVPRIWRICLAW